MLPQDYSDQPFVSTGLIYDVDSLNDSIALHPKEWERITGRQDYEGSAHKDTETIFVRMCKNLTLESAFHDIEAIDYPASILMPLAKFIAYDSAEKLGAIEVGRILIVRLKAGGKIEEHIDEGLYADYYTRFHVPLETNPDVAMVVDGAIINMKPGEVWYFNKKLTHHAVNNGDTDRTHLIVDMAF